MVKISPIVPFLPKDPSEFCTNPYDVIESEEEMELKKNPNSLIHLILPDGEGEDVYSNARKGFEQFVANGALTRVSKPSIFLYRQESKAFSQQGLILGVALEDYEKGEIVKHEHTREKPLKDRTKHISTSKVAAGLVWNVFKTDDGIKTMMEEIKKSTPIFDFEKYGYRQIVWQVQDEKVISDFQAAFASRKLFIADGHHRAASAAAYRKILLEKNALNSENPAQYLLTYIASDDQIRIYPYNRVIRKLPMEMSEFLEKLGKVYEIQEVAEGFNPAEKHQLAIFLKGKWYKLSVKDRKFANMRDSLDVAVLQDKVLAPILKIEDPRKSDNIFFVGGITDPKKMEKFVSQDGNDLFINLYPVDIKDLESIAEAGGVMPPKSTWFDPKVLSGLVIHTLE